MRADSLDVLSLNTSSFRDNVATVQGQRRMSCSVALFTCSRCSAMLAGGAVLGRALTSVEARGCNFTDNRANAAVGAAAFAALTADITDCVFARNMVTGAFVAAFDTLVGVGEASIGVGGLGLVQAARFLVARCQFIDQEVVSSAINCGPGTFQYASPHSGGVFITQSRNGAVVNSTFRNNGACAGGAVGMWLASSTRFSGCQFEDSKAIMSGGAIDLDRSSGVELVDCEFHGSTAYGLKLGSPAYGGDMYVCNACQ